MSVLMRFLALAVLLSVSSASYANMTCFRPSPSPDLPVDPALICAESSPAACAIVGWNYVVDYYGYCRKPGTGEDDVPPIQTRVGAVSVAEPCPPTYELVGGQCQCPAGQQADENGVCYTPQPSDDCPNGREKVIINGVENCLLPCPEGTRDPVTGQCNNHCSDKAGTSFTTASMAGGWVGCYSGCVASCAIGIQTAQTYSCTYTGGTCEDDGESPDYGVPSDQQPQGPSAGDGGACGEGTSYGSVNGVAGCYGGGGGSTGSGGNTGQPTGGPGGGSSTGGNEGGSWYGGNTGGGSADSDNDGFADGYGSGGGSESEDGQSTLPDHTETEHGTFADVLEEFYQDLYRTDVVRAIDGLKRAFASGQGTPPTPSFEVFGQTFTIDFHVQLMESGNVRSVLYAVFTLIWVVVGIRIIASA